MKKKLLISALAVIMVVTAIAGASLAYLTDKDSADNVFTIGKVDITLNDEFVHESLLMPGVDVSKEVGVTVADNSQPAYVRVHIAIPAILDSGAKDQPQYASYNNTLHWNFSPDSLADGLWNWNASIDDAGASEAMPGWPGNGGNWNSYTTEIDGIEYNVYVATYETILNAGETTAENAIYKVFMDTKVTSEQLVGMNEALGGNWSIKVVAEGVQAASFDNAYEALNTAFGAPGTYEIEWPEYGA